MIRAFSFVMLSAFLLLSAACQHQELQHKTASAQDAAQPTQPALMEPVLVDLSPALEPGLDTMFPHLAPGARQMDGIPFLVTDRRVHVRPGQTRQIELPATTCANLHFLHFTENSGEQLGTYILHYADGTQAKVPLQSGVTIQDWWRPGPLLFAAPVYLDSIAFNNQEQAVGFQRFSMLNPHPDRTLTALEVVNTDTLATVNLIALTLTAHCGDTIGTTPLWVSGLNEEQFLIALLKQQADVPGKAFACQQLIRIGTLQSVPVLAACLEDEKLSHPARLTLAAMAYPEAKAALRDALPRTHGAIKAGIIESLGTTRDPQYLPLLAPCINDPDPTIALSTTLALGRIGGPQAIAILKTAAQQHSGRLKAVALDSLLCAAESLSHSDRRAAYALYTDIYQQWPLEYAGPAAYGGMIRNADTNEAARLIAAALLQDDPQLWNVVLPAVRTNPDDAITRTCQQLLQSVPEPLLPDLIGALGQRGDPDIAPALAALIPNDDPLVYDATIEALAWVGDGSAVEALVTTAANSDHDRQTAALQTLAQMSPPNVHDALIAKLEHATPAESVVIAQTFGQRKDKAARPALQKLLASETSEVRLAAIDALAEVGTAADTRLLCQVLAQTDQDKERSEAQRALVAIGKRLDTPPAFVRAVLRQLQTADAPLRCALLDLCADVDSPRLLKALNNATTDPDPAVQARAIRALASTENPDALPLLVRLLDTPHPQKQTVQILRGIAHLTSERNALADTVREHALLRGLAAADRPEEQKMLLGVLATCPTLDALQTTQAYFPSENVAAEAIVAWGQIAEELLPSQPQAVEDALPMALAAAENITAPRQALQPLQNIRKRLNAVPIPGDQIQFQRTLIDPQFRAEGVAVADVNRDGQNDILAGDLWYAAPHWQAHEIRPPQSHDPNTGYSRCFANFTRDVDEDGWMDSIIIGFPGAPAYWYQNPGGQNTHWNEFLLATAAAGETPVYADLLGDGNPVPLFALNSRLTWFRTGQDKLAPWEAFPISQPLEAFAVFGHGLGVGDVNADGRADVLSITGIWQGPVDPTRPDWDFLPVNLGPDCANMLVYDVDGDGDNDIITSSAHNYGLWWFEQRQKDGLTTFEQHPIHNAISQTHALILADINNDGLQDLVTGKRYYAHNGHDPGAEEPAILCWFELQRTTPGQVNYQFHQIDANSGVGTQFEVCDVDDDGLLDVVTANKKGIHLFVQRRNQ